MQKIVGGSSPWHPPVFNLIYVWSLDDSMKGARLCGQFDVHPFHLRAFHPRTTTVPSVPSFAIPVSFLHLLLFPPPPPPPPTTCAIFLLNDEYKLVFLFLLLICKFYSVEQREYHLLFSIFGNYLLKM